MTGALTPWMHTLCRIYSGSWPIECAYAISARDENDCLVAASSFASFNVNRPNGRRTP